MVLAPTYIAEISTAENRGKLVSIQQLNIVLGFFAAFLSNYYFNQYNVSGSEVLSDETVWRWMLGVEFFPAIFYFGLLFFVPKSPRWLYTKNRADQAKNVLERIHGSEQAEVEIHSIEKNIEESEVSKAVSIRELFAPALRFIMIVGITLGILQQVTGINAIYFYATSIFKQTGIGTDAAFSSGVLLSFTTVVFTLLAIYLIDRIGRRPLLLVGMSGIAVSLLLCAYSFNQATYELSAAEINSFENIDTYKLAEFQDLTYQSDVAFKNDIKAAIGNQVYAINEGAILEAAIDMNAALVLIGILGFIACFAFSLGPVMWVTME